MRLAAGKSDFQPAFRLAHWLVTYFLKAEFIHIKLKSFVLIGDANGDRANFREHTCFPLSVSQRGYSCATGMDVARHCYSLSGTKMWKFPSGTDISHDAALSRFVP